MRQEEFTDTLEELEGCIESIISFFDDLSIGRNYCVAEAKPLICKYVNDIFERSISEKQDKATLLIKFENMKKGRK